MNIPLNTRSFRNETDQTFLGNIPVIAQQCPRCGNGYSTFVKKRESRAFCHVLPSVVPDVADLNRKIAVLEYTRDS